LVATTLLNVHENLVTLLIIAGEESSTEFTDNETINDGGVVFFTEFARDNENAKEVLKQRTRSSTDLLWISNQSPIEKYAVADAVGGSG
jgi:hypothetical protein